MSSTHEAPKKLAFRRSFAVPSDRVDIAQRTIAQAVLCRTGEAKGHGLSVNGIMLKKLLSLADAKGVKCYWTHQWENAGRFLGRFGNLAVANNQLTGDLTLSALSDELPNLKGLGTYILKQVSDDADVLMCSVVFSVAYYFQTDESGKEYKVWQHNDLGNWVSPNYEMPIYAMPSAFISCDIVGNGAVTDSMFRDASDTMAMENVASKMQSMENQIIDKKTIEMSEVKTPELNDEQSGFLTALTTAFKSLFLKKEGKVETPAPVQEATTNADNAALATVQAEKEALAQEKAALQLELSQLKAQNEALAKVAPSIGTVKAAQEIENNNDPLADLPAHKALFARFPQK